LSNYQGIPSQTVTIEEGITYYLGSSNVKISSAMGCSSAACPDTNGKFINIKQ